MMDYVFTALGGIVFGWVFATLSYKQNTADELREIRRKLRHELNAQTEYQIKLQIDHMVKPLRAKIKELETDKEQSVCNHHFATDKLNSKYCMLCGFYPAVPAYLETS